MCLEVKNSTPKIAEQDIVCYKVLQRELNDVTKEDGITYVTERLITPFFHYPMEPNKLYEEKDNTEIDFGTKLTFFHKIKYTTFVEGGTFHTFKNKLDARFFICDLGRTRHECVIMKCVIPKGTKYFEGRYETWSYKCYASKSLKTIQVI